MNGNKTIGVAFTGREQIEYKEKSIFFGFIKWWWKASSTSFLDDIVIDTMGHDFNTLTVNGKRYVKLSINDISKSNETDKVL